ncbi:uncharacterized protein LOC118441042 isoform X2 [Vespa mandarinia]|uniref:uncharacterized protein LOC118441042 isoform X2 n=1 Tax=Vespa mandarinia TaxID=7446 RepID=UPI00161225AE|nr:uncharacterized protein LOC118441042 isoform X2 [Vespa mandarinia]
MKRKWAPSNSLNFSRLSFGRFVKATTTTTTTTTTTMRYIKRTFTIPSRRRRRYGHIVRCKYSFIRVYVLDNVIICIFIYVLLYIALWYANKVIQRIKKSNEDLSVILKENQMKLDDLITLKKKKTEYEEIIVKAKGTQKVTTEQLESECERTQRCCILSTDVGIREIENGEEDEAMGEPFGRIKILEPSFPPPMPPEPPPRKYGIFASRPFSGPTPEITIAAQNKIGFK